MGQGRLTLVVGSGMGEDAVYLAGLGFHVVAFDISATAIASARRRFPAAPVDFRVANLLEPPLEWRQHFSLVLECYTVQALPVRLRPTAVSRVSTFVAAGGRLLVLSAAREHGDEVEGPPWPLTRQEVESFVDHGLSPVRIEEFREPPDRHHWRAEFSRAPDPIG